MLNKVIIMGRITKDLEVRMTPSGTAVLRFTVAVDRMPAKQGGEKQTDFISCVAFGKRAEFINQYFGKGRLIAIEGNIKTGSYEDKGGRTVYTTDIWVDSVSFTGEKSENNGDFRGGNNQQGNLSNNVPNTAYNAGQTGYNANDYEDVISEIDDPYGIPF